jgi:hypothetical protein
LSQRLQVAYKALKSKKNREIFFFLHPIKAREMWAIPKEELPFQFCEVTCLASCWSCERPAPGRAVPAGTQSSLPAGSQRRE